MTRRELFPLALAPLASALVPAAFGQTVPRPAEELMVNNLTGGRTSLKAMKGKVVAVELLLTWCSHCQASARVLQDLYTELKPKGFEVMGVATNTDSASINTRSRGSCKLWKRACSDNKAISSVITLLACAGSAVLSGARTTFS